MKLSTKGRYGITLMIDLGMFFGEGPVSLKSVAERQSLSEHYLEQLIAPLRNAGLVRAPQRTPVRDRWGRHLVG